MGGEPLGCSQRLSGDLVVRCRSENMIHVRAVVGRLAMLLVRYLFP